MKYNPNIHHRHSIRLKGYDYSQAGLYFITICVKDKECLFGEIVDGKMIINDAGIMVEKWYYELKNKYPDIECGEFVVMPNHFHCIIINNGMGNPVGADLRVCPDDIGEHDNIEQPDKIGEHIYIEQSVDFKKSDNIGQPGDIEERDDIGQSRRIAPTGSSINRVIQWFKTMTTNEYIHGVKNHSWQPFNGKLWQRNYYEHIIRDEKSYQRISEYIVNNPGDLQKDKLFNKQ